MIVLITRFLIEVLSNYTLLKAQIECFRGVKRRVLLHILICIGVCASRIVILIFTAIWQGPWEASRFLIPFESLFI